MKLIQVLIVVLVLGWIYTRTRRVEKLTDEKIVTNIVEEIQKIRPELVPVETMYIDTDGSSRILFLNTDTYAGEVYDYSKKSGLIKDIQGINDKQNLYDYVKV